ncbi:MAG TPA: RNA methyltransferase [Candidatus Cloacimonadota bacterium]|nr:RNA methyltransferase [Candidatus Cloacimonadota bacterium]
MEKLSKNRCSELANLKQKKYRQKQQLVVLEGQRLLSQMAEYGIQPLEIYSTEGSIVPKYSDIPHFQAEAFQLNRICESQHPPTLAGLYPLPQPREVDFETALYLDHVADPGNLGTIFRLAAAFSIAAILLSDESCEISSPKVIRAALGAVYQIPWRVIPAAELSRINARIIALDMDGSIKLPDYHPDHQKTIYVLGSEAHGISPEIQEMASATLRIPISNEMESLNVAITAGILCYHLYLH